MFSIIIPSFNNIDYLKVCIASLKKNSFYKNEIIVHINIGVDGSIIKTIAFGAVDNDLSAYLLKKNNKLFNIAGKLSLNEWRGQSNVEFIIDDISVNKTFKNVVPSSIG